MAQDVAAKLATEIADIKRQLRALNSYQLGRSGFTDGTALPDVILASNRAVEQAAQAIADSATALAKADGVVNTWYQENAPTGPTVGVGDFWVKTSTRAAYIRVQKTAGPPPTYEWVAVSDPDVAAALAAAQAAEAAADGKISTWFQPNPPSGAGVGDIWYDTDDQQKPYRWNGSVWQPVRDGKIQDALDAAADAQGSATTALNSANGKTRVVYSTNNPGSTPGTNNGDTWFRIDSGGTVVAQFRWTLPGATWMVVEPQSVTVASLDAGKITTGTLAAGVTITAGTPGSTRTEISAAGIRAYVGSQLRMSFTGSTSTVIADTFRSAVFVNGGTSYVQVGDIGDGTSINGIQIIRPGGSMVTLKNTSDSGGGVFEVSLRNGGNVNEGGFQFSTGAITSMSSFFQLRTLSGGSSIFGGQSGLSLAGGQFGASLTANNNSVTVQSYGGSVTVAASSVLYLQSSSQVQLFGSSLIQLAGSGFSMNFYAPRSGEVFLRNNNGQSGLKFVGDTPMIQARNASDSAYAYVRGIEFQPQSDPAQKMNIVALDVDALELFEGVGIHTWDWREYEGRETGIGFLLTELPWIAQPDPEASHFSQNAVLALLVQAVKQLNAKVENR